CKKIGSKSIYIIYIIKGENLAFCNLSLMHVHVLMLHRKFELIPIKFGFLTNF
uniref:Uncharacterized protein n=1 Tax=Amphimedon queenslandica TaxID=400682 RepID=A0A1X7T438_AMPQE